MSFTANTGEHKVTRSDIFLVDPAALIVDWKKNLSRNGEEPPVDQDLMDLARDMVPKKGHGDSEDGTSGQLNPILVRPLGDRRLEVIGGFRRMRAALWLIESGECPDFKVKYIVSRLNDAEAALVNISENIQRKDLEPIQIAHAVRSLTEDYGLPLPAIAGRLKRSVGYLSQLLDLVTLPTAIQRSIAEGHTTVTAGLELAKVEPAIQLSTFNDAKDSNGKVKATAVKKVARKKAESATANTTPAATKSPAKVKAIRRDLKDVIVFLETKTGPAEGRISKELAETFLGFISGRKTDGQMDNAWGLAFGE